MQSIKLTPKKVAQAIGVSESSMKRWCDRGLIDFQTTAGGHRRLSQASVIDFLRGGKHALIKSELIGLPSGIRPTERNSESSRNEFFAAIVDGHEDEARKILFELFIGGHSIAQIGDSIIGPAFNEIGRRWECGDLEIYRERRACELTIRLLSELRPMLPEPKETAPLAIGGAPGKESYTLPTMLIEMLFRETGWRAQSLGTQLPFSTLTAAVREQSPRLFWLSVSSIEDETSFLQSYEQFRSTLPPETFVAVGGNAVRDEGIRQKMKFSAYGDNLMQLESLAKSLPTTTVNNGVVSNY